MFSIALCESSQQDSAYMQNLLDDYELTARESLNVKYFPDAEQLLQCLQSGDYRPDLIITGIFLPGMSGIDAARTIRRYRYDAEIIFATRSTEHAIEAYELEAVQYLVKPVKSSRLFRVLDRLMSPREKYIFVRQGKTARKIPCSDILYCETLGKYQVVHTKHDELHIRITAREMKKLVHPPKYFYRLRLFIHNQYRQHNYA